MKRTPTYRRYLSQYGRRRPRAVRAARGRARPGIGALTIRRNVRARTARPAPTPAAPDRSGKRCPCESTWWADPSSDGDSCLMEFGQVMLPQPEEGRHRDERHEDRASGLPCDAVGREAAV